MYSLIALKEKYRVTFDLDESEVKIMEQFFMEAVFPFLFVFFMFGPGFAPVLLVLGILQAIGVV